MNMTEAYRVLGVLPTADDAVVRAAYLALMKRYHPDQPGADVERAKAVASAYQLLSDPDRRAAHEVAVGEHFDGGAAVIRKPRRQTGRLAFFAISAATVGLLYAALTQPVPVFDNPSSPAAPVVRGETVEPVAAELPLRPDTGAEPEPVVVAAPEPAEEPEAVLPDPRDIPLPTPTPLPAPVTREAAPKRAEVARAAAASVPAPATASASASAPAPVRRTIAGRPTPARDAGIDLAALDRHQVVYYNQSFLAGDAARRSRLMETRLSFLKRLSECGTDACRRDAYLARNQEVAAIMRR